jgi:hypothetical protein
MKVAIYPCNATSKAQEGLVDRGWIRAHWSTQTALYPNSAFCETPHRFLPRSATQLTNEGIPFMRIRSTLRLAIAMATISAFCPGPLQAERSWNSLNPFRSVDAKSGATAKPKTKTTATKAKTSPRRSAASTAKKSKKGPTWIDKTTRALKWDKSTRSTKPATSKLARTSGKPPLTKTKNAGQKSSLFGSWFGADGEAETKAVPGWTPAKSGKESY